MTSTPQPPSTYPSPGPIHARIATELRERIDRGEFTLGEPLPSERTLASTFGISRMTARQALMILESDGYVRRRSPTGTIVARRLPIQIGNFPDELTRSSAQPDDIVLWTRTQHPPTTARDALHLNPEQLVHTIARLRTADGEALAIETTHFPQHFTPGLLDKPLTGPLWTTLRRDYHIHPHHATATLEVTTLDESTATLLNTRTAAPAICVTRRTYDEQNICIEYATDLYPANRIRFEIETNNTPLPT